MGKCSNLTILQSQQKTFQKGKDDKSTDTLITVLHQPIENFIEDLPALFEHLFTQPFLVLLQYPALPALANKSVQRKKPTLLTDITSSDIGVVDIDCLEGVGNTIEEQVNDIIDRYFPIEWKLAKKIIKPSSSYYMKGQSKFHVFFILIDLLNTVAGSSMLMIFFSTMIDRFYGIRPVYFIRLNLKEN